MKNEDNIIWNIKELYEWAVKNECEEYTVFTEREGCETNVYKNETFINRKDKTVSL